MVSKRTPVAPTRRSSRITPRSPTSIQVMSETDAYRALEEENRLLRERLAAFEGEDRPSRTQSNSPEPIETPDPPMPMPPVHQKELKIGEPPTFDGKASEFHPFVQQATLYIEMRHLTFPKDKDKFRVAYIISRLRGGPAEWGQSLLESRSPLLTDYDAFLAKFTSIYENKERRSQLEDRFARLKQTGSASAYSAEFSSLCAILSIDPNTQMGQFRLKLKSDVQTALAFLPAPPTFDQLSTCAIRIDNAQFSARRNTETRNNNPSSKSQQPRPSQQQSSNSSRPPPTRLPPVQDYASNPPSSRPGPSHSSAPYSRLTDEEKDRRKREKLCGYCGDATHTIEHCPGVAAKNARKRANDERSKPPSFTSHAVVLSPPAPSTDNHFHAPNSGKSNA
jgi:Domain of unknown function (DUF4939)